MEKINSLQDIFPVLKDASKQTLIVAWAHDAHTLEAVSRAAEMELVHPILTGDKSQIQAICDQEGISTEHFEILEARNDQEAARLAVESVAAGHGDLIMKGTVSTDKYMRAILNREAGLMEPNALLTHISVFDPVRYRKLLIGGDVAIIPLPGIKEKIVILRALIHTAHAFGIDEPKVALIAATEQTLPGMPACTDAAILTKMAERGQISGGLVDGPLALDIALDEESARVKKIDSPVTGDADCLLFPNIESGNVFYKCHTKLLQGDVAAMVYGARVPAVLSSRGDTIETKLYSIALAALMALMKNR